MVPDNQQVYCTVEFDNWTNRSGLTRPERFLIEKFLERDRDTLEAGTAGGRILLDLQRRDFTKLSGFDYVHEFIEQAKKRDSSGTIDYAVMDARQTRYPDERFDQIIYLQQIISCIETSDGRDQAIREAYRILRPGGIALISFCSFDVREASPVHSLFLKWISVFRGLRRSNVSVQNIPWLKHGNKWNWHALLDRPPYVYWFRASEAEALLRKSGFSILAVGTDAQVEQDDMVPDVSGLVGRTLRNHIYFVCRKS